ncbi:hypothetical protein PsorP6_016821 [Peronosclerospora sorghi]|uniref:Uncharacterized protein n=1 Tax=Peronosclerospora sorghi TaxID=230839 RepID=A0ACC0WEG8_9STRA|nr:hypothetical protein PsorP6_016821 [Peronosclerospora sorghi]
MFTDPRVQDLHELGLDDVAVSVAVVHRAPKHGGRRVHLQDEVSETKAHVLEHDKDRNLEQEPARLALSFTHARGAVVLLAWIVPNEIT